MTLSFLPDLRQLSDQELDALYNRCFKSGHTNLFDPPGYKFGAGAHIEREVYRRKIIASGWKPDRDTSLDFETVLRFEIERHRQEFHRQDSHYREYSNITRSKAVSDVFTADELEHIIDHFSCANDPFVQELVAKAQRMLDALPD